MLVHDLDHLLTYRTRIRCPVYDEGRPFTCPSTLRTEDWIRINHAEYPFVTDSQRPDIRLRHQVRYSADRVPNACSCSSTRTRSSYRK
jgi:hypothetical protein